MRIISFLIKFPILKRLLSSLLRKLFIYFKKENFKIKFKNLILETDIKDPHDREIFFTQKYDEEQFAEIFSNLKKFQIEIFIDVGANSGIYSLLLANKFNNLIIHAFEPIKSNYNKFLKNIKNNKLENIIKTYNFGLSDKNAILKMLTNTKFGYKQSAGYSVYKYEEYKFKGLNRDGYEKAKFVLGDELLKYKNKNIFIKIDTEGHELFVIMGIYKLIKNNNIFLQIEIWDQNFKSTEKKLNDYGLIFVKKIKNDYFFKKSKE